MPITCPTGGTPEQIEQGLVGCGSAKVAGPDHEGFYDCLECGLWFRPEGSAPGENRLVGKLPAGGELA